MDLADQPALALERARHLTLRIIDAGDRARERIAKFLDFPRGAKLAGKVERCIARSVVHDGPFEPLQRPDQESVDEQPADERRRYPHQNWKEQDQAVDGRDSRLGRCDSNDQCAVCDLPVPGREWGRRVTPDDRQFIRPITHDQRLDFSTAFERRASYLIAGQIGGPLPADDSDWDVEGEVIDVAPRFDIPRRYEGNGIFRFEPAGRAQQLALGIAEGESASDRGGSGEFLQSFGA